jgi:hypothetical protein
MCVDKVPRRVSGPLKTAQAQVPDPQGGAAGVLTRGANALRRIRTLLYTVAPTFHHHSWESPGICASRLNDPVPASFWERSCLSFACACCHFYFNKLPSASAINWPRPCLPSHSSTFFRLTRACFVSCHAPPSDRQPFHRDPQFIPLVLLGLSFIHPFVPGARHSHSSLLSTFFSHATAASQLLETFFEPAPSLKWLADHHPGPIPQLSSRARNYYCSLPALRPAARSPQSTTHLDNRGPPTTEPHTPADRPPTRPFLADSYSFLGNSSLGYEPNCKTCAASRIAAADWQWRLPR